MSGTCICIFLFYATPPLHFRGNLVLHNMLLVFTQQVKTSHMRHMRPYEKICHVKD